MQITTVPSPLGPVTIAAHEGALVALGWDELALESDGATDEVVLERAREALAAYLEGDLDAFAGLPLAPRGTPFERRVWEALRAIPAGERTSYGALAASLGIPRAARAVGAANGKNPIAIAIPCHRVVGASGALTGYAHGLHRKRWLLEHEGASA